MTQSTADDRARYETSLDALAQAGADRRAGGRLAEVGAAGGEIASAMTERGFEVTAVGDEDATELELEPGHFDLVHCSWLLHRLADPEPAVRVMARATRPGGQVVLQWGLAPAEGHAHTLEDTCMALHAEGLEVVIAEEDVEVPGVDGYGGRVVAHRPAPTPAEDDSARPPRVRAFPLCVGILEVVAVKRLTANMRRIVFTGGGIAQLPVEEPGEIVSLIWPAPGSDEIVLPSLRRWRFPDGAAGQHARNMTVRSFDRRSGQLTIDFFLHGEDGRATRWARAAGPGDTVGYGGPRLHWTTDPDADWTLLIGDETALPAIGAIIEQRPAGHRTIAVGEIESAPEEQALGGSGTVEMHWVHRGERPPGTGTGLLDAVAALDLPEQARGQVWAAGESMLMRGIREHLRNERGLPRECLSVLGYWKRAD